MFAELARTGLGKSRNYLGPSSEALRAAGRVLREVGLKAAKEAKK